MCAGTTTATTNVAAVLVMMIVSAWVWRDGGQQLLKTARGREKWMRFEHENERSAAMADGN